MTPIRIDLYDPHSWDGPSASSIVISDRRYEIYFRASYVSSSRPHLVLICDEFTTTKLPLLFPRQRRVALLKESPIHIDRDVAATLGRRFDLVLTNWETLLRLGHPFVRLDFSTNWVSSYLDEKKLIKKTKMISFLGSIAHGRQHGYGFRQDIANAMMSRSDIDCFGRGILEMPTKISGLAEYRFSIAMENCRENFYFTEKIIDCFFTDTVPIYWGCPKIHEIFDRRGIITFDSLEELHQILSRLDEQQYLAMLPYVQTNRRRCIDLGYDSFESYLVRCLSMVEKQFGIPKRAVYSWEVSKSSAGLRLFGESMDAFRFGGDRK